MWSNTDLHIHLFNEEIVFRGCKDTASGQTLRGYVLLHLCNIRKITGIQLRVQGVATMPSESPEIFVQYKIEFLEDIPQIKVFNSGTYMYHFELPLTGDLPESVQSRNGSIQYTVQAIVKKDRFSLQPEFKFERLVRIRRVHSAIFDDLNSQELLKTGEVHGELGFTIYSNSNSYQPGQEVALYLGTRLLNDKCNIESIQACIIEAVKYRTRNGTIKSNKRPLPNTIIYENLRKHKLTVHSNLIRIPVDRNTQPDCRSEFLKLTHLIEIQICLVGGCGVKKYILIRTPIHIDNEEEDDLPSYVPGFPGPPPKYE